MEVGLQHLIEEVTVAHIEESRSFNAAALAVAGERPPPDLATPEGLEAARSQLSSRPPEPRAAEHIVSNYGRQVPVRILTPEGRQARAVYLQIHGGGFYMDSAARSDTRNARLADALGVAVVSVDYRLAPEEPWPAAPDDCETADLWLVEEAEESFGTARLMIGGASAGANLAVVTLLRLRDRGLLDPFVGTVLQFGAYDLSGRAGRQASCLGRRVFAVGRPRWMRMGVSGQPRGSMSAGRRWSPACGLGGVWPARRS